MATQPHPKSSSQVCIMEIRSLAVTKPSSDAYWTQTETTALHGSLLEGQVTLACVNVSLVSVQEHKVSVKYLSWVVIFCTYDGYNMKE